MLGLQVSTWAGMASLPNLNPVAQTEAEHEGVSTVSQERSFVETASIGSARSLRVKMLIQQLTCRMPSMLRWFCARDLPRIAVNGGALSQGYASSKSVTSRSLQSS